LQETVNNEHKCHNCINQNFASWSVLAFIFSYVYSTKAMQA